MNDLEPKLGPEYIQSTLYYDKPITYANALQYTLNVLQYFQSQQELKKIQDNIIEAYFE